jgi:hypothetical protein
MSLLLADILKRRVSFHARNMNHQVDLPVDSAVQFPIVVTNDGGSYNPTTGQFVSPYSGTYFFIASTVDDGNIPPRSASMVLMVDNTEIDAVFTEGSGIDIPASVHGVVRLSENQTVWVKVKDALNSFDEGRTAFSGFLIHS